MSRIPAQAREGLIRAWLDILREEHPDVTWVAIERKRTPASVTGAKLAPAEVTAVKDDELVNAA
jgi:hypothetical protein